MKANELMIGDWVDFHNGTVIEPRQVTGVLLPNCIYLDFGYEPHTNLQTISLVEPIPLTAEILEKNGFEQIGEKFIWGEIDDNLIEITPSINNSYRIKVSVADLMISCSTWCSYVHQLQHALRILGIKKEIEL